MAGVELATAYVSLVVEGSQIAPEVKRRFRDVGPVADRAGRDSGKRFGGGFGTALKGVAGIGIGTAIAGIVKTSIGLEASFSKTMAQIGASTDGAAQHMDELNKLAMRLGAETSFSASDAAAAMLELGKAGINASDIMGGALSGTLTLAAAGGTDLGTAATIAANAMNTFGLKGKNMASIAAALAGGANASSASVESLGQALQQVGPGATNAGLSLQETVGTLSAFDAAGIKGSDAGTSLKTMLSRLVPQTDAAKNAMADLGLKFTDAKGNFVPITNIAEQLKDKLTNLSEAQRTTALTTIFGSDASRAATVLMKQGSKGIEGYIKATKDQAAAEKLAKANMSGTAGAIERLKGSIETAELALGQALAPTVQDLANFLSTEAVPAITGFVQGMQDGTGAGGGLADVLKTTLQIGKGVVGVIDGLPGPVKKFGVQAIVLALVLGRVNAGLALVGTTGVGRFVKGMAVAETRAATMSATTARLSAAMRQAGGIGGALALYDGMKKLDKQTSGTKTALGGLEVAAGGAAVGFALGGPLGAAIGGTGGAMYGLVKTFGLFGTASKRSREETQLSAATLKSYEDTLDGVNAATTRATRAMVLERLEKSGLLEATRALGLSDREAVNAMTGEHAARVKLTNAILSSTAITGAQKRALELETGALGASRLAQLRKNVALAQNKQELQKAEAALRSFMKAPASKRVSITGAEKVKAELNNIRIALDQVFGRSPDTNISLNGLGVLPSNHRAGGGPVTAGQAYVVGEHRPELFVPNTSGRIMPRVPTASSSSSLAGQRLALILGGQVIEGVIADIADTRIGAQQGIDAMTGRAL